MLKGLSANDFEGFLEMLDPNRDEAAEKYISLRERLERFFEWRDCENPQDLTDIVFDRVVKKIREGEIIEKPEAFCVSVAKFVLLENRREVLRDKELDENTPDADSEQAFDDDEDEERSKQLKCLDECLNKFPDKKRDLIKDYYDTNEKTLIPKRKSIAENLGITLNTLRIRVCRLKSKLEKCTRECCEKA